MSTNPPRILFSGITPLDYEAIVDKVAATLTMPEQPRKLLLFYCGCSYRFTPAAALIASETGIAPQAVRRVRAELVSHGLIEHNEEENYIYIDWDMLRRVGELPEECFLDRNGNRYSWSAMVEPLADGTPRMTIGLMNKNQGQRKSVTIAKMNKGKYRIRKKPPERGEEGKRFYRVIESMTVEDVEEMTRLWMREMGMEPKIPVLDVDELNRKSRLIACGWEDYEEEYI